jgi:rhodanese-related sulfurtransferase
MTDSPMTEPEPMPLSALLRTLLPAIGLAACVRDAPEWPRVLADVRAKYPDVRQLGHEELLQRPPELAPLLFDARAPDEFEVSHLLGARSTPDEPAALAALAEFRPEREIVLYCSVGMRSSALAEKLLARGYTRVANLEGGIFAWANADLPVYRGTERVTAVHPFDDRWGTLLTASHHPR